MKRLIAILLSIALLVMTAGCTGENTEPTEKESIPAKTETTEAMELAKVTVYLLDKVTTDYGDYTVYSYDENYNVDYCEDLDESDTVFCTTYFEEKDANGMAGVLREVWDSGTQYAYVRAGSMQITQSCDLFMYRNVTRTEKQSSSSDSGGSSRSSGGSSRSTGGGSF